MIVHSVNYIIKAAQDKAKSSVNSFIDVDDEYVQSYWILSYFFVES
jgi:hypothetical protein